MSPHAPQPWLALALRRLWLLRHPTPSKVWFRWALARKDPPSAEVFLEQAERHGHPEAAFERGLLWAEGAWGAGGRETALLHFRRALAQGHGEAAYRLAEAHRWGHGLPKDPEEALRHYRLAAERGCGPAQAWLARAYALGDGVEADPREAARWQARIEGLDPQRLQPRRSAVLAPGKLREAPSAADEPRIGESWMARVADLPWSERLLGAVLGLGVAVVGLFGLGIYAMLFLFAWGLSDLPTALWVALVSGLPLLGMLGLLAWMGRFHSSGRRLSRHDRRLRKAAEAGDPSACYHAGRLHLEGAAHWPKDPITARIWFTRAAQAGHAGAMVELARLLRWGAGGPRDVPGARGWLEAARDRGEPSAQGELDGLPPP